jgi:hypothetical protein
LDNLTPLFAGECDFKQKVDHAKNAGAIAVIIIDYKGNEYIAWGERKNLNDVTIPSVIISNTDGDDLKSAGLCTTVNVGSNTGTAAKTVEVDAGYTCPATVNRDNWLGADSHPDIFSVTQTGNSISVLRTDTSAPWDMNLQFHCCAGGETVLKSSLLCILDPPPPPVTQIEQTQ